MKIFRSNPSGFFRCFLIVLLAPLIVGVAFNVIIDPYGIFNFVRITGVNAVKPLQASNLRLSKSHIVRKLKPTAAIFGTSRIELAIDPEHPSFNLKGYKTYNMGMAGAGLYEILVNLKHTYYASNQKLKFAIIGLDFLMFNSNREDIVFGTEVFGYDEKRLLLAEGDKYSRAFLYDIDELLLFKAVLSSIRTIKQQHSQELYLENGMRDQRNNMLATGMSLAGHRAAFINNEKYYMEKIWTAGSEEKYCTMNLQTKLTTFDTLKEIIEFARTHNIELRLYLSPTHARKLIALDESGLWPALEEVKRGIVNSIENDAKLHPNSQRVVFWDFMNVNSITTEPLPTLEDKEMQMQWYWEVSHYKKATGSLILNKMMDYQHPELQTPADFGVILTTENLEQQLQKLHADTIDYGQNYPEYKKEIREMANAVFSSRNGAMCTEAYKLYFQADMMRDKGEEQTAMKILQEAQAVQLQEENTAKQKNLSYREKTLRNAIKLAICGQRMNKPLKNWIAYQDRGDKSKANGELTAAIDDYTEAIKRGPRNSALLFLRGTTLAELGKHDLAIQDFNAILDFEPNNQTIKFLLKQSNDILAFK